VFRRIARGSRVGHLPLTAHAVPNILKGYCARADLDPAEFSGHSLRSGFLTSAAEAGASIFKMVEVSRHKSVDTLHGYVRRVDFSRNTRVLRFCDVARTAKKAPRPAAYPRPPCRADGPPAGLHTIFVNSPFLRIWPLHRWLFHGFRPCFGP
jgi:hypothetical protein